MGNLERNITNISIITLSDNTKVINGVIIPTRKQLKKWIAKNHPEYLDECEANGEFKE